MHFVTKFFVICAAVLSIFLSALVVAYAANAGRITQDYQQEVLRRVAAEASLADQRGQHGSEVARLNESINDLSTRVTGATTDLNRLQAENARLQADKASVEGNMATLGAQIAQLTQTNEVQTTLIKTLREEAGTSRTGELTYRKQALEMEDRISDLESQNEVLNQTVRALQEQLTEARLASEGGAPGSATTASATESVTYTGPMIVGKVEEVTKDPSTGQMLAKINLGTSDQIRDNLKLYITRGKDWVANLIVVKTDQNYAIGRVDTVGRADVQVVANDTVQTRLQ